MKIEAHAKINWTLEVLGTRPDGYHDLRSIVLPIALHDDIEIEECGEVCIRGCDGIPQEKNLAYGAAMKLKAATGCGKGAAITITKRIPAGGGLGGGSADAAAVLNGLNEFWGLGLTKEELCRIGAEVGSDVPALVLGGAVLMEGRGERVRRYEGEVPDGEKIAIRTLPVFSSTPRVYGEFRDSDRKLGENDLQPAAIRIYPEIGAAIEQMKREGYRRVTMSGSGSTIYGIMGNGG